MVDMLRTALVVSLSVSTGCAAEGSYRQFGGSFDGDGDPLSEITGKIFDDYSLFTSPGMVENVALSRDGRYLAARQTNVKLWDVRSEQSIISFKQDDPHARWIGFDDQRDLFGILRAHRLEVWDPARMKRVMLVEVPEGQWFSSAACLHDGEAWIAFRDYRAPKVQVLHAPSMAWWELAIEGYDISFSPSCDAVVVHDDKQGTFIELTGSTLKTRQLQWQIDGNGAFAVATVNRSEVWAAGNGELKQFDMVRDTVRRLPSPDLTGRSSWARPTVVSHDGQLLALATDVYGGMNASPATVHLLDSETGQSCAEFKGHGDSVHGLAFSADGRYIASGSRDQKVRIWRVPRACRPNGHFVRMPGRANDE